MVYFNKSLNGFEKNISEVDYKSVPAVDEFLYYKF
jgi:hypothetical protein